AGTARIALVRRRARVWLVFRGERNAGPYFREELDIAATRADLRVVPVLLPGVSFESLPRFLAALNGVRLDTKDALSTIVTQLIALDTTPLPVDTAPLPMQASAAPERSPELSPELVALLTPNRLSLQLARLALASAIILPYLALPET